MNNCILTYVYWWIVANSGSGSETLKWWPAFANALKYGTGFFPPRSVIYGCLYCIGRRLSRNRWFIVSSFLLSKVALTLLSVVSSSTLENDHSWCLRFWIASPSCWFAPLPLLIQSFSHSQALSHKHHRHCVSARLALAQFWGSTS